MPSSASQRPLPTDPGEIVARGFGDALDPKLGLDLALRNWPVSAAVLSTAILAAMLPPPADSALWGLIWGATLTLLVPWGLRIRDEAWLRPDQPLGTSKSLPPELGTVAPAALALGCLVLPAVLGFWGGLAWALLLVVPGSVVALVVLAAAPLHQAGTGFPFVTRPRRREAAAMGIAGLITAAGCVAAGFLAWAGSLGHLAALLLIFGTWTGANRSSGLLARRLLGRLRPVGQTTARPAGTQRELLGTPTPLPEWFDVDTTATSAAPSEETPAEIPWGGSPAPRCEAPQPSGVAGS
jgi:hypothetical protein